MESFTLLRKQFDAAKQEKITKDARARQMAEIDARNRQEEAIKQAKIELAQRAIGLADSLTSHGTFDFEKRGLDYRRHVFGWFGVGEYDGGEMQARLTKVYNLDLVNDDMKEYDLVFNRIGIDLRIASDEVQTEPIEEAYYIQESGYVGRNAHGLPHSIGIETEEWGDIVKILDSIEQQTAVKA